MPNPAATANSRANPHPQPGETTHTVTYIDNMSAEKTDLCADAAVAITTAVKMHCQESKLAAGLAMHSW